MRQDWWPHRDATKDVSHFQELDELVKLAPRLTEYMELWQEKATNLRSDPERNPNSIDK